MTSQALAMEGSGPEPPPVTVTVLDAASGDPLPGATVLRSSMPPGVRDPGTAYGLPDRGWLLGEPLATGEDGRVVVPRSWRDLAVHARAPGRAWAVAALPFDGADSVEIRLRPGGDLRVRAKAAFPLVDVHVVISGTDAGTLVGGECLVEGLPPGTHGIRLARGGPTAGGDAYGEGTARVTAGKTAEADVPVSGPDRGPGIAVTLRADFGLWLGAPRVPELHGIDAPGRWSVEPDWPPGEMPAEGTWTAMLPAGRYRFEVPVYAFASEFRVASDSPIVEIPVGKPAYVAVVATDAASGEEYRGRPLEPRARAGAG